MQGLRAEVCLWNQLVGTLIEDVAGAVSFQYDDQFHRLGWELSPLRLPTKLRERVCFPELARIEAFGGMPGVFADALPDRFGNAVIRRYYREQARPVTSLTPVQRLLYLGNRAMGALEFRPAEDVGGPSDERLRLAALVEASHAVVADNLVVALPEIYRIAGSAGGARPKAVVLFEPLTRVLKSAFAKREPGDQEWIVKFAEAEDAAHVWSSARIERAYMRMAETAGIIVPESELWLDDSNRAHFAVRRFDRASNGTKIHMHSLGGLIHSDFNTPGTTGYEQAFRAAHEVGLDSKAFDQLFRRMVFNVAARNQDDHVKNMSFLMDDNGAWSLAPSYDLTFAEGTGCKRYHQMTVGGKVLGITESDLLTVGETYSVSHAKSALLEVSEAVQQWLSVAKEFGVSAEIAQAIRVKQEESGLMG